MHANAEGRKVLDVGSRELGGPISRELPYFGPVRLKMSVASFLGKTSWKLSWHIH